MRTCECLVYYYFTTQRIWLLNSHLILNYLIHKLILIIKVFSSKFGSVYRFPFFTLSRSSNIFNKILCSSLAMTTIHGRRLCFVFRAEPTASHSIRLHLIVHSHQVTKQQQQPSWSIISVIDLMTITLKLLCQFFNYLVICNALAN